VLLYWEEYGLAVEEQDVVYDGLVDQESVGDTSDGGGWGRAWATCVKKRVRARPEETILLTIVKEQDGSSRSHWTATDGPPKRNKAHFYTQDT